MSTVYGRVRMGKLQSQAENAQIRRLEVFPMARHLFGTLPPGSVVAVEEALVLPKNIETTRKLVMMAAVLEAAFFAARPDATLHWVSLSTWRRKILDPPKGHAPRNKEGWKSLAMQYVLDRADTLWPYRQEELDFMATETDLFEASCLMAYARRELAV